MPDARPRRRAPGARRAELLHLLEEHEGDGLAISELASATGLHPNTVRAHLEVLVREGRARHHTDPRPVPGRPRELYLSDGTAPGSRNYELLARLLAGELAALSPDPAASAVAAGRQWSEHHGSPSGPPPALDPSGARDSVADRRDELAPVLRMLRTTGFAPALSADGAAVELHHCPFRELAEEQPEIVCGAHLGLIQGTLARIGAGVTATAILPFVEPGLCLARLEAPAGEASDAAPHLSP
ncbi:helix-turn-helix transcriptional regulator [Actinotalea sp.]|uniref:helix-turn-helix transcriptional regulator n=1 Tax=Actinotalea sp. TaxID=1872145 RepID=UPI003566304B